MTTESKCRRIFSQFGDIQTKINFLSFPANSFFSSNRTLKIREKKSSGSSFVVGFQIWCISDPLESLLDLQRRVTSMMKHKNFNAV